MKRAALLVGLFIFAKFPLEALDELPPAWPDPAIFKAGETVKFRLPFFAGLYTYSDNTPLYNLVHLPKDYDPKRAYPLCVRLHPQGGNPDVEEFVKMTNDQAIVVGSCWPLAQPREEGKKYGTIGNEDAFYPAVALWAMRTFNVDRTRVYLGGFSLAGFTAIERGIHAPSRNVYTHFVILGAGLRGQYYPDLFKGKFAFIGVGTGDDNMKPAQAASALFKKAGMEVEYFEEQGLGHAVGDKEMATLIEWYKRSDPAVQADAWMKDAAAAESKEKKKACEFYAKVSTLGPNDARGKAAREKLEVLEGSALVAYEKACERFRLRDYIEAKKLFEAAGREAQSKHADRLVDLCTSSMALCIDALFIEEMMDYEEAFFTGRPYEGLLMVQDGAQRFGADKHFAERLQGMLKYKVLTDLATAARAADPKRCAILDKLMRARVQLWSGKGEPARKDLEEIAKNFADKPEGCDAKRMLDFLDTILPPKPAPK